MSWLYMIALLLFPMDLHLVRAVDYRLDGKSHITYTPSAKFSKTYSTIHMLFRTAEGSGLLLHARGTNGDFITLEIVRGKLRYASMFGRGSTRPGTYDVIVGDDLGDDQWHQIDIERNRNRVIIKLDITRKKLNAERWQKYQNIDEYVTVAGLPPSIKDNSSVTPRNTSISLNTPKSSSLPPVSLTGSTFKGCMEDVTFNKVNIFKATKEKSKDVRVLGKLWPKCADDPEYYPPATLSKSTSFIKVDAINGQDIDFKFKFRTFDHTGVLVHISFGLNAKGQLLLELLQGKLRFSYAANNLNMNTIISPKYTTYANGIWHKVQLNLTSKGVAIQVNNETTQKSLNGSGVTNLLQNPILNIGTSLKDKPSMRGCVREIELNGKDIEVSSSMSQGVALDQCYLKDVCFKSPCLHQGVCKQHNNMVQCDCTNTGYSGSGCQNISASAYRDTTSTQNSIISTNSSSIQPATDSPSQTTSKVIKTSVKPDSTVRPLIATTDKLPVTLPSFSKPKTVHTTQSTNLKLIRNSNQTSTVKPEQVITRMSTKLSTTKPKQFITPTGKGSTTDQLKRATTPISKQASTGQLKHSMSPTSKQIVTVKPKRVITRMNKNLSSMKPNQSITLTNKQTTAGRIKHSTTPTGGQILTGKPKRITTTMKEKISTRQLKQPILTITTQIPTTPKSPATLPPHRPTPQLNLPTHPSTLPPHRPTLRLTLPTTQTPTHNKRNTQVIIIEKSNTINNIGFNKNQLLVYLFLFIVFLLFVGLIVIISVKMSYFQACSCLRRFQTVRGSLPSQDSIELGEQGRKESSSAVKVKTGRPSSLNDSGIDRSESGTDSHRSSAEVQDEVPNREDLGISPDDRGELGTSPDDSNEGFLILQEDPSLYTQKSFGWTVLNSTNTIRHCRTSTRDLIHAPNENKPRAFRPAYYPNSEISEDVRVDAEDDVSDDVNGDVTKYRNPTTSYRQLATSDCSSLDNVSIDMEQCKSPGLESKSECPVF